MRRHILLMMTLACLSGCQPEEKEVVEKKPRPVTVKTLQRSSLKNRSLVTAVVGSWKTEQIGMEVTGRIESVVEPNTYIEGRVTDSEGNIIIKGTPIAKINSERYELQVESQQAQVARAEQAILAAEIQLNQTLPAQIRAAEAEKKRAETEYQRSKRLLEKKAGAQADVDRDEANRDNAISQIDQLNAALSAQEAELLSAKAQLRQAQDALRDAERNLEDCTLFSSFRGQISDVAVVPGSVVSAGQPVATIQMMDPIKVEVEVSAEDSRRLRNRQRIPVLVPAQTGSLGAEAANQFEEEDGYLYLVDPVADPQTRTFTLTLLIINEPLADESAELGLPWTNQTWRTDFEFLPGAGEGKNYVSDSAIYEDEQGHFLWHVTNVELGKGLPDDRIMDVKKVRIQLGDAKLPFLGNWNFQEIEFLEEAFNPKLNLVTDKIHFRDGEAVDWEGGQVLFQNERQWKFRPGDLVKVDLSDNKDASGVYVPMDSIAYEGDQTYLFLLNDSNSTVERMQVSVTQPGTGASSVVAVSPIDSGASLEGRKYVCRGAHYLVDGEKVRPVEARINK